MAKAEDTKTVTLLEPADLQKLVLELQEKLTTFENAPDLGKVVAELQERVTGLEEQIVELTAKVEKADTSLVVEENKQERTIPTDSFVYKIDGKIIKYKFNVSGIRHEGRTILASEAGEDMDLLKLFVETYPNSVTKLS
jgi:hypothetical protein